MFLSFRNIKYAEIPKRLASSQVANQSSVDRNKKQTHNHMMVNNKVQIDPVVLNALENAPGKVYKKHPGILNIKVINLPNSLVHAVSNLIEKYPVEDLKRKSQELVQYLWSRHSPVPDNHISELSQHYEEYFLSKEKVDVEQFSPLDKEILENKIRRKTINALKYHVYHWKPMEYNAYTSFLYMVGRMASDYGVLSRIFNEIAVRHPKFRPKTLFDFGSGVGTVMWAANSYWKKTLYEHYCVDTSPDMTTVARLLLQGGEEEGNLCFEGVYFRGYSPASNENKYDLVVSAYSLIELPSKEERLKTLLSLWNKCDKYMIIVENGTNAGFNLVSEARDFILQVGERENNLAGHVFAPCPHDSLCPRAQRNDRTPCNFEQRYEVLSINKAGHDHSLIRYSYVILKKGERDLEEPSWPRIVRDTTYRSKRVHCQLCTSKGDLQRSTITKAKHGPELFKCAKAASWGDLLPAIVLDEEEVDEIESGRTDSKNSDYDFSIADRKPFGTNVNNT